MEQSPLVQQARPTFQPKVIALYQSLFQEAYDGEKSEGFWTEFFLLKCQPYGLIDILRPMKSNDILHLQPQTRELFSRAAKIIKDGAPTQVEIALDTLNVFLREILAKRYTNLSSDVIALLTGLDNVDNMMADFVGALDNIIRNGQSVDIRHKAIRLSLCMACGAFQTGLLSYFTHRDLFPALTKFVNETESGPLTLEPFVLLGVLANYNKFEFQNPYQLRLSDFVNEDIIKKMVTEIGRTSAQIRQDYISVQEDLPEGWSVGNVLSYVGLGALTGVTKPKTPPPSTPEAIKAAFEQLPSTKSVVFLPTYDFAHANKLFLFQLVDFSSAGSDEAPISAFISVTSYLLQHAYRSVRTTLYARTNLLIFRLLLEDQMSCKHLSNEENKRTVRLCRQRRPHLPVVRGPRLLITAIIDVVIDGISHNLKPKLDVDLYLLCVTILQRALSYLIRTKTRLTYHWSEVWRSILAFIRFLTSYSNDLKDLTGIQSLVDSLVNVVALSLTSGDAFLPSAAEYDDLFYKLVETGDILHNFSEAYALPTHPKSSISVLISVSDHYKQLITEYAAKTGKSVTKSLSPQQVSEVIKSGYETLSINAKDGLDSWDKYREHEQKSFLKKVARMVVVDVREKDAADDAAASSGAQGAASTAATTGTSSA